MHPTSLEVIRSRKLGSDAVHIGVVLAPDQPVKRMHVPLPRSFNASSACKHFLPDLLQPGSENFVQFIESLCFRRPSSRHDPNLFKNACPDSLTGSNAGL